MRVPARAVMSARLLLIVKLSECSVKVPRFGSIRLGDLKPASEDAFSAHVHENSRLYFPLIKKYLQDERVEIIPVTANEVATLNPKASAAGEIFAAFTQWVLFTPKAIPKLTKPQSLSAQGAEVTDFITTCPIHIAKFATPWVAQFNNRKFDFTLPTGAFQYTLTDLTNVGIDTFLLNGAELPTATSPASDVAAFAYLNFPLMHAQLIKDVDVPPFAWRQVIHLFAGARAMHVLSIIEATERQQTKLSSALIQIVERDYIPVSCGKGHSLSIVVSEAAKLVGVAITNAVMRCVSDQVRQLPGNTSRTAFLRRGRLDAIVKLSTEETKTIVSAELTQIMTTISASKTKDELDTAYAKLAEFGASVTQTSTGEKRQRTDTP